MLEDITGRKELERQIADLPIGEQRKIGQELHDSTGQELTGLAYMARSMVNGFAERSLPELGLATRVAEGIEHALNQLRMVAQGPDPGRGRPIGLMAALEELAARTDETLRVACTFDCGRPGPGPRQHHGDAPLPDRPGVGHERPEARPGPPRPDHPRDAGGPDVPQDSGRRGGHLDPPDEGRGMGLRIMAYRAGLIGATLKIEAGPRAAGPWWPAPCRRRSPWLGRQADAGDPARQRS